MKTRTTSRLVNVALAAGLALTAAGCGDDPQSGAAGPGSTVSPGTADAALDDTSLPPWPAPTEHVPARVAAAGLDLGPMGTAEHYHPRLTITIDGKPVPVPLNIGVDPTTGAMSAVHTHEGDGTIHIEAHTVGEEFDP